MKLQILYDNNSANNFKAGWGFSCLIKIDKRKILFDTGLNGFILLNNMKMAGINPEEIDTIVISHSHWDHIGGLNHILDCTENTDVYIFNSASKNLKCEIKKYTNIIEVTDAQKVYENIYTTGELGEKIKEQFLVLFSEKGNIVLTGCAHPGLENVIKISKEFGDIHAVIGGFHDSNVDVLKGIPIIVPCHCSEKVDEIKNKMPESFQECRAGCSLKILNLI